MEPTYRINRLFFSDDYETQILAENLTLEEAKAWCKDPETSSRTCKLHNNVARTEECGPWFESWEEEE